MCLEFRRVVFRSLDILEETAVGKLSVIIKSHILADNKPHTHHHTLTRSLSIITHTIKLSHTRYQTSHTPSHSLTLAIKPHTHRHTLSHSLSNLTHTVKLSHTRSHT